MVLRRIMNILRPLSPHLPRFRPFLYSFLILLTLLGVCYCLFWLFNWDFHFVWLKVKWTIFRKSLHFLFYRFGWAGSLFLAAISYVCDTDNLVSNMMMPSGPSGPSSSEATSVDQGPTRNEASSSGSGSWRQYLNLSSDKEGNSESTSHTSGQQPQGEEASGQPTGVMGPEEPSIDFLKERIKQVLRPMSSRATGSNVLTRIYEDLHLETAPPAKLVKIYIVLEVKKALAFEARACDRIDCHAQRLGKVTGG